MLPPVGAARGGLRLGKEAPSGITRTHIPPCDRPVPLPAHSSHESSAQWSVAAWSHVLTQWPRALPQFSSSVNWVQ